MRQPAECYCYLYTSGEYTLNIYISKKKQHIRRHIHVL